MAYLNTDIKTRKILYTGCLTLKMEVAFLRKVDTHLPIDTRHNIPESWYLQQPPRQPKISTRIAGTTLLGQATPTAVTRFPETPMTSMRVFCATPTCKGTKPRRWLTMCTVLLRKNTQGSKRFLQNDRFPLVKEINLWTSHEETWAYYLHSSCCGLGSPLRIWFQRCSVPNPTSLSAETWSGSVHAGLDKDKNKSAEKATGHATSTSMELTDHIERSDCVISK